MSEGNKRYYWLKLPEDFFRQKEIKQLRKIAGGSTFTIIYLKMLLRSLKDGGRLYYEGIDDDFVSELSLDIDEDVENVKMTVAFLLAKGILVQCSAAEYELLTAGEMTGSEGYSAQRMRRLRGRKQIASQSDSAVTASDEEIDIEKDKEIEKKRKRFTPPTIDEIRAYAAEKEYSYFNAEAFEAYYASKGWVVGKAPMKDWKAAVRGWAARDKAKRPALEQDDHDLSLDEIMRRAEDTSVPEGFTPCGGW